MIGEQLAIVRLDDTGSFSVCVPWRRSIFLEVTATDWIECDPPWAAETVFPDAPDKRYFAYSPTRRPTQYQCGIPVINYGAQYIETWVGDEVWAAAFFPATQIAFEMQDFFSASELAGGAEQTLRDTGALRPNHDYRASFVYPLSAAEMLELKPPCDGPAQACYRPPHLYLATEPRNAAVIGKIIEHEYSHRAHHAKGGWPGPIPCNFCESVAEFIRAAKEDNAITRGQNVEYLPWPQELEHALNSAGIPPGTDWPKDYYWWAPGLYDLFDLYDEDIDDNPTFKCDGDLCPYIREWSQLPFRRMWDVFENVILDTDPLDPATAGRRWTKIYVNANGVRPLVNPDFPCHSNDVWSHMRRTSVFHVVYTCNDTFPEAPPTPTTPP